MAIPNPKNDFTAEAYLTWENQQSDKHEYINGEVFAMVGVSDAHARVAGNLFATLLAHLRGSGCQPYISDMKLQVEMANAFFYPDIFVTCDKQDAMSKYYKQHPKLIIEVLSDSTAAFDRGQKFAYYRQLESLQEYVLVDPDNFTVDCFRLDTSGHWVLYTFVEQDELTLASVDLTVPMSQVFENVINQN